MPLIKPAVIRQLDDETIHAEIQAAKRKLFDLRFAQATRQEYKSHEFMQNRRYIRQLETIKRERQQKVQKKSHSRVHQKRLSPDSEQESFMDKIDPFLVSKLGFLRKKEKSLRLNMLIRVSNTSWNSSKIPDYKETFRLKRSIGCIGGARTIEALQKDPEVVYVEAAPQSSSLDCDSTSEITAQGDRSNSKIDFLKVTKADKVHTKEKGKDAIIAVIDSSINIIHPAFLDEKGRSRFLGILDLTGNQEIIYSEENIRTFIESFRETSNTSEIPDSLVNVCTQLETPFACNAGHGTHVASISAGKAYGNFSGGIAPEAKLIIILDNNSPEAAAKNYAQAIQYIKSTAKKHNKPVVINLSRGYNIGSHDGKYLLELLLEDDCLNYGQEENIAVVKSAGNERVTNRHLMIPVTNSSSIPSARLSCVGNKQESSRIEVWFDSAYSLEFKLKNPSNEFTEAINETNNLLSYSFNNKNSCEIFYRKNDRRTASNFLQITIYKGNADLIEDGIWELSIIRKNSEAIGIINEIHAWIDDSTGRISFTENQNLGNNQLVTITTPGNADNIITVGSIKSFSQNLIDDHGDSSRGPTRINRNKPDLVAPGVDIDAACVGNHEVACSKTGTSMSAPQVTGAIALAFSARNQNSSLEKLTVTQIISCLRNSCQPSGSEWNDRHGCGLLDIERFYNECTSLD